MLYLKKRSCAVFLLNTEKKGQPNWLSTSKRGNTRKLMYKG
jgi:hypothetical protein